MESPPRAWIPRLMPMWSGSGRRKTGFSSLSPSLVNILQFSGQDGQNRSPPPFSGSEGFQEKLRTSSYRPSFFRHVPALVEEEFQDPESASVSLVWSVCCAFELASTTLLAFAIPLLVLGNEIWLRIPGSRSLLLVKCFDEHSVCEFSSGLVEDSVVPVASDLKQQLPTIQMVHKFVPNILPHRVFPSVVGDLESNKRDLEDGILAVGRLLRDGR